MSTNPNVPARTEESPNALVSYADAGMYEAADERTGSQTAMLKRLVKASLRYKWLILLLVAGGTGVAFWLARQASLQYEAEARIWVDVQQRGDGLRGPVQAAEILPADGWLELLRTNRVLDPVVRDQGLYLWRRDRDAVVMDGLAVAESYAPGRYSLRVDPQTQTMQLFSGDRQLLQTAQFGDSIGQRLGFLWAPVPPALSEATTIDFTVLAIADASKQLADRLEMRPSRSGNFLRIAYRGSDPEKITAVVNAVADEFVEVAAELKRSKLTDLRTILKRQLDYAENNLSEAELSLESFRVNTITLPTEGTSSPVTPGPESTRNTAVNAFVALQIEREALQRDMDNIQRILIGASTGGGSLDALGMVNTVRSSTELTQALAELATRRTELRRVTQQYTDQHPQVQRAREDLAVLEQQTIPALGQALAAELNERIGTMDRIIARSGAELRDIPVRAIEEGRRRRGMYTAEQLYTDLRSRYEGAVLAEETSLPDVRLMEAAREPRWPVSDPRLQLLIIGVLGSLVLGIGIAFVIDLFDPRLRYAEQVTNEMGLSVIGAVPSLNGSRKLLRGRAQAAAGPQVVEALRQVRLNILHAYGSAGPIMVTITSPGSGDGKSFMSSNLSLTFSDLGMRTLVIDGDTRRGCLHRMFTVDRKPGLTDYLTGEASYEQIVRRTRFPQVDVIPGGKRVGNSPELLQSARMGDLLAQIRSEYDVILVDSPPLGAGVDPLVLGTLTGNLVLVMRTGNTERAMAEAKLKILERLPIRVLGTVLNCFDGFDAYNYYSYMPGYEASSEEPEDKPGLLQPV